MLHALGHGGDDFCFYRCNPSSQEARGGDADVELPAEISWSAQTNNRTQTVASWRDPLLRPLQVFDGYAAPGDRRLIVDLSQWPATDDPSYTISEINLADASGLTYHLMPYDWSHRDQPVTRQFFVTFPNTQEGSPLIYRILGYRHHTLGHVQVSNGAIMIRSPATTFDHKQGGTRLSLDAAAFGSAETIGASLNIAARNWSNSQRQWLHLPEFEVGYRAVTRGNSDVTEHRLDLAAGVAIGWLLNRHFHVGFGARVGLNADMWTPNLSADQRLGLGAQLFFLLRYHLSALVAIEFEASPLGISLYRGDPSWSGVELRFGPRVWSW